MHFLATPKGPLLGPKASAAFWNVRYHISLYLVLVRRLNSFLLVSEKTNNLQPISPQSMSISPDGHVLLTLDTLSQSGPGGGGLDLFVWGTNYEYQLGNGKRTSIAVPTTLSRPDGNRFMLMKTKATEVKDARGKLWKKGIEVEQVAVAGQGNSVVYWRICS